MPDEREMQPFLESLGHTIRIAAIDAPRDEGGQRAQRPLQQFGPGLADPRIDRRDALAGLGDLARQARLQLGEVTLVASTWPWGEYRWSIARSNASTTACARSRAMPTDSSASISAVSSRMERFRARRAPDR
jgi:hypothetical protein